MRSGQTPTATEPVTRGYPAGRRTGGATTVTALVQDGGQASARSAHHRVHTTPAVKGHLPDSLAVRPVLAD